MNINKLRFFRAGYTGAAA
jgi:hypothetical protein